MLYFNFLEHRETNIQVFTILFAAVDKFMEIEEPVGCCLDGILPFIASNQWRELFIPGNLDQGDLVASNEEISQVFFKDVATLVCM